MRPREPIGSRSHLPRWVIPTQLRNAGHPKRLPKSAPRSTRFSKRRVFGVSTCCPPRPFPPSPSSAPSPSPPPRSPSPCRRCSRSKGDYSTFLKALEASDAGWFLEEDLTYTALIPTDAAFDKLPEGVLDALLREENRPKLNAILEGHVVPEAEVMSSDLSDGQMIDPATGEPLEVSIDGDAVMIGGATVVDPDIEADDGVAHGIDTVIVPEMVVQAMKFTGDYPTQ